MSLYSIILCGGQGARLWPESTPAQPKPFIDLIGDRSLFERTVARMAAVSRGRPPLIVTGVAHVAQVREQLRSTGGEGVILAEPEGRDSGPALLAAALWVARADPGAVAVAVASDHHIPDDAAFLAAVDAATRAAQAGRIVTFGVRPRHPATGYGYIRRGEVLDAESGVLAVGRFVEKPDSRRAEALVAEGCLWNSGNFMFRADALIAEAAAHAPDVLAVVEAALAGATRLGDVWTLGPAFGGARRVSIDVAVLEKTRQAAVLPIDYAWTDLGSWDAVWAASSRDGSGNTTAGTVMMRDSQDCLVRAGPGMRIVGMGLRGLAVIAHDGDILVSPMEGVANLKPALEGLAALSVSDPRPLKRPGGEAGQTLDEAAGLLSRWFRESALPLWWCFGADRAQGGFHESLGQDLRPTRELRRARVQARQVHVYALAGARGWPGPWEAAVDHGVDYMMERFRRPDGLFRASVEPDGRPANDAALLYDQAFVLLAFATAARALPMRAAAFESLAWALVGDIRRAFGCVNGGFHATEGAVAFLSNPVMHLFEATLAWAQHRGGAWTDLSAEVAGHFLDRMVDPCGGHIAEHFNDDWRALDGPDGRFIEPGHQFEWAYLIARWSKLSGDARAHEASLRLFGAGERGVDPVSGLVLDALLDDFTVLRGTSRLWPQTERVKAAIELSPAGGPIAPPYSAVALGAAQAIRGYLETPIQGLWRDAPAGDQGPSDAPSPASSFYHIAGAIVALEDGLARFDGARS